MSQYYFSLDTGFFVSDSRSHIFFLQVRKLRIDCLNIRNEIDFGGF